MRSPLLRTTDTGARISFPVREAAQPFRNLRAQSTARPRYPFGILFNLSLSLYRICPTTEKRSLFFIPAARIACIYFPGTSQRFLSVKRAALPAGWKLAKLCVPLRAVKSPFLSFLKNRLVSSLSFCFMKLSKLSWRIFITHNWIASSLK